MSGATYQGGWADIAVRATGPDTASGVLVAVGHFRAYATCLQVSGNDGIATAVIEASTDPTYPVGEVIVAEGVDNGGTGGDLWRISFADNGGIYQESADCWLPFFAPVPIQRGHIIVS